METNELLKNYGERIKKLEEEFERYFNKSETEKVTQKFVFQNKKKNHNELLEELLKSDYCHSKNGLSIEEVLQIFSENGRPVVPKKIRDLLAIWKNRKKIEAIKLEGILRYFWIENE